ncbi:hypothetical protein NVP1264O_20 [Vibrio phage 1.264.O._10N.286.51.F2]|nr:hypothetical protein NVP1264O_20 [Vibrio phage 1.264.O._10N.286.51.F2]
MEYKGFKIVADGTMGYKHIAQMGSGAVPKALSGRYTTESQARVAIDGYKPKRGAKKNVKGTPTA